VQRELKGDLDNILMMALRKEPQHRYSSVEQLANDLRNYLDGQPVHARGNALRYRTGKFIRRHKIEIAAGVLVIISLVTGIAISLHQAKMAEQQRQIAQRHFDGVRHLANTLLFDFHDQIKDLQGATKARDLLVKTSLEYLNTLAKETGSDRGLQEELAIAFKKVGDIQGNVGGANTGDPKGAQQSYGRAIELLQPVVAADASRHRAIKFMGIALTDRARLRLFSGEFKVALADAQQGVSLLESLWKIDGNDIEVGTGLVSAYKTMTEILDYTNQPESGEVYAGKAITLGETLRAAHPDNTLLLRSLAGAYTVAASLVYRADPSGEGFQKAMSWYRSGEKIDETIVRLNAGNARYQYFLATTRFTIANTLCEHRDYEEALRLIRLAQPAFAAAAADNSDVQAHLANVMANFVLAKVLVGLKRDEEARPILLRNVETLKQVDPHSDPVRTSYFLAQFETILASLYSRRAVIPAPGAATQLENWQQAKAWYEDSIVHLKKLSDSGALDEGDNQMMTEAMSGLATTEAAIKKITH
jgi:tetratricopeptide (TPR) repeat protein